MKVEQIATIMNGVTGEILGEDAIAETDLTKILDKGKTALGSVDVENYTRKLIDHVGRVLFVDRPYSGRAPSLLMESWQFGSVLEKITSDIPDAEDNPTWGLVDGATYNQDVFTAPDVNAKFYNSKRTLQTKLSLVDRQVYSAFDGVEQVNALLSMLQNYAETSLTVKADAVIMETICGMIGETLANAVMNNAYSSSAGNCRAVNLLKQYNDKFSETLTAAAAVTDPDFIKYASYVISLTIDRMQAMSRLFNIGGHARFTPGDRMKAVFLSDFYRAAGVYLESGVFHNELLKLPKAETVPFWQGSGTSYAFGDVSKVYVKTPGNAQVQISGVLGVVFDAESCILGNMRRYTTTHYNANGEFLNNWFKWEVSPFIDLNENFVVFYAA